MKKILASIVCLTVSVIAVAEQAYTLSDLRTLALRNNIATRTARHDIEAAQQQRKEAFTKYFPSVSGTGLWFNANRDMAKMTIDPAEYITPDMGAILAQTFPPELLMMLQNPMEFSMMKNGVVAAVTAVQPVFAGGQIVNGNRLARVGEDVSNIKLELSIYDVEKTVEQYFWQLVTLQEKTRTLDAVEALLADIHKDVDVAVRAGVTLRNDLLQVELRQNDIESQRLKLNNGIGILKLLLAQYCGLDDDNFTVTVPAIDTAATQATVTPWKGTMTDFHLAVLPEYRLLEKQLEAAKLQRKITVGQNLPQLGIGAGYTFHNLLKNNNSFFMVFATLNVPISDWWGGSHAIKRRKIEEQRALEQLNDNAELLEIRARRASNDVAEAQMQLSLAMRSITQAEENLRINRDCYRAGTATMTTLLEAQLLYQQALDRRVEALAALNNRLVDYRHSLGLPAAD